jgi:hypothetical protein
MYPLLLRKEVILEMFCESTVYFFSPAENNKILNCPSILNYIIAHVMPTT